MTKPEVTREEMLEGLSSVLHWAKKDLTTTNPMNILELKKTLDEWGESIRRLIEKMRKLASMAKEISIIEIYGPSPLYEIEAKDHSKAVKLIEEIRDFDFGKEEK